MPVKLVTARGESEVVPALASMEGYAHWQKKGEVQEALDNKGVEEVSCLMREFQHAQTEPTSDAYIVSQ
eukprot:6470492-Amphidinium_carterae.2